MIAHEIAHQWFGNMATEKSFGHLWLSEGFATYFAMLYEEEKYGKEKMIELLSKSRNLIVDYSRKKRTCHRYYHQGLYEAAQSQYLSKRWLGTSYATHGIGRFDFSSSYPTILCTLCRSYCRYGRSSRGFRISVRSKSPSIF